MCRFKNKKGFSLIELMVVVAIMGVLASIGIPQYIQYRRNATYAALEANLTNVERAVITCVSAKQFSECTSGGPNSLAIANTQAQFGNDSPNICAQFDQEIGGVTFSACVEVNAVTGNSRRTFNERTCYTQGPIIPTDSGNCSCVCTNDYDVGMVTATSVAGMTCASLTTATCDSICNDSTGTTPCEEAGTGAAADAFCAAKTGQASSRCHPTANNNGMCGASTGECT